MKIRKEQFSTYILLGLCFFIGLIIPNPYIKHLLVMVAIYSIIALGMNLITGFAGQINLGMAGFVAIGAYTSAVLTVRGIMGFWGALIVALIFSGLVGLLVGLPALKVKGGVYLVLITSSLAGIVQVLANQLTSITRGPMGLVGIPAPRIGSLKIRGFSLWLITVYLAVLLVVILLDRVINSRVGRNLTAVRESDISASSVGINPTFYKLFAFILSAMLGGLAGALMAHYMTAISPDIFTFSFSMVCLVMIVIGGVASIPGSIIGAIFVTILPELLRGFGQYQLVIYSALLILAIVFLPYGLFQIGLNSSELIMKRFVKKG